MIIQVGGSSEKKGTTIVLPGFTARESKNVGSGVSKDTDDRGSIPEVRYRSTKDDGTYLSGYYVGADTFHIVSIVNAKRKTRQTDNIADVIRAAFKDMKDSGVAEVTSNCILKLVPILMKRYGFQSADGKTLEEIILNNRGLMAKMPGMTVPLVKRFK